VRLRLALLCKLRQINGLQLWYGLTSEAKGWRFESSRGYWTYDDQPPGWHRFWHKKPSSACNGRGQSSEHSGSPLGLSRFKLEVRHAKVSESGGPAADAVGTSP
jgi:hypothetical protein